jgi:putative toxin-antitoxin system antitoxin component (TIGR02293 family)
MKLSAPQHRPIGGGNLIGSSLGFKPRPSCDLIEQVEAGLPFAAVEKLHRASGLPVETIAAVTRISPRTLSRRKSRGRLSPEESDRLLRLATLFELALSLFQGDAAGATRWLTRPQRALGQRTPLTYARTEVGAQEVRNLIGRLEHGVFT